MDQRILFWIGVCLAGIVLMAASPWLARGDNLANTKVTSGKAELPAAGSITMGTIANTFFSDNGPDGGFWATVSQKDDDLRRAYDLCYGPEQGVGVTHVHYRSIYSGDSAGISPSQWLSGASAVEEPDKGWEACLKIDKLWRSTGASARWEAIQKTREDREKAFVKSVSEQK